MGSLAHLARSGRDMIQDSSRCTGLARCRFHFRGTCRKSCHTRHRRIPYPRTCKVRRHRPCRTLQAYTLADKCHRSHHRRTSCLDNSARKGSFDHSPHCILLRSMNPRQYCNSMNPLRKRTLHTHTHHTLACWLVHSHLARKCRLRKCHRGLDRCRKSCHSRRPRTACLRMCMGYRPCPRLRNKYPLDKNRRYHHIRHCRRPCLCSLGSSTRRRPGRRNHTGIPSRKTRPSTRKGYNTTSPSDRRKPRTRSLDSLAYSEPGIRKAPQQCTSRC